MTGGSVTSGSGESGWATEVTVPIFELAGQVSAASCEVVHFVAAFGLPVRPAGSWTVVLLTSSVAAEYEKLNVVVKFGCPPPSWSTATP